MSPDLFFVIGISLGVMSIPSMLAAITEGHAPYVAVFVIICAGVMIIYAARTQTGGYSLVEVPDVFIRVIAGFLP